MATKYEEAANLSNVTQTSGGFSRYAWLVLALNLFVIVWGAVVRATGAGAGCGEHWPLCNGAVIPPAPQVKTLIEYGHRLTSGLALILVIGLVVWAFRMFPKGHLVRRTATFSLVFELSEALIGAALVLLGHVAGNQSIQRGYSLALHLSNTLLLIAALALTARFSGRIRVPLAATPEPRKMRTILALAATGVILVGISGAIAALGDTLFASTTLAQGMQQDFSASAHPFVRLRILHPIFAAILAIYILAISVYVLWSPRTTMTAKRLGVWLLAITCLQVCLGVVNLVLLAPVPVQLMHLLLADLLWIAFILFSTELLVPSEDIGGPAAEVDIRPLNAIKI